MNVSWFIAKRYLFSKKSKSVINIISAISIIGIFVSTASLVIVLSGFNGVEGLVKDLYGKYDADITIIPKIGKTFDKANLTKDKLEKIDNIYASSYFIEQVVMIMHNDKWATAKMKGVEESYKSICLSDSVIYYGNNSLWKDNIPLAILGLGIQNQIQVNTNSIYNNISVYALLRDKKLSVNNKSAFKPTLINVGGVFNINPEYNNEYFIVPIKIAQELLDYNNDISGIDISVKDKSKTNITKQNIVDLVGDNFTVKTKYQKNELIYKINKSEKWMVFSILIFILLLSTFNIVASLTMLILDKKKDIYTLSALGANQNTIKKIFFKEGFLISFTGGVLGMFFGIVICFIQIKFHLISLENSIISYWPVVINYYDLLLVFIVLIFIGILSSVLPTLYLIKKHTN